MQQNVVIFGATSSIAQEVAKLFSENGDQLFLVGRHQAHLIAIADDLKVRGSKRVSYECYDLTEFENHPNIIDRAIQVLGRIDTVLIAHGTLSDQKKCEADFHHTYTELNTNLISHISLLTLLANYFEKQGRGCLAVISSVAGDRGRQSNYVYGTAKAGLSVFLQGLRNRLYRANVNVLTIKPGFVDTPMTVNFKKGLLWSSPQFVAKNIVHAINKKRSVIYTPFFWRYIMMVIKSIPENIFRRLSL